MSKLSKSPRCRVCGSGVRVCVDETAQEHEDLKGRRCDGTGLPLAGAPPCTSTCRRVGTVGWPRWQDCTPEGVHAATAVCDSPSHQDEAAAWVESITGHSGVFQPDAVQTEAKLRGTATATPLLFSEAPLPDIEADS